LLALRKLFDEGQRYQNETQARLPKRGHLPEKAGKVGCSSSLAMKPKPCIGRIRERNFAKLFQLAGFSKLADWLIRAFSALVFLPKQVEL